MAISIKGKLADKAIELLGGRNVTEKRVEGLLAELAESRARIAELTGITEKMRDMDLSGDALVRHGELGGMAVPKLNLGLDHKLVSDPTYFEEDEASPEDPVVLARHLEVQPPAPPPIKLSPEMQMMQLMMAKLEAVTADVQALKAPATEEDKKKAMADGKLPAVVVAAGPTGYTGSAQLPRGVWFPSPLGPNIPMKLCDCKTCTPFRVHHYFCVICKRGPLAYMGQTGPKGRKQYTAPGSTWGVTHECCSVTCYMRYLELLGVAPGVNDAEPPSTNPSEQPMVALGSD